MARHWSSENFSTVADKILSKVEYDTNGGCWLFSEACSSRGYGKVTFDRK